MYLPDLDAPSHAEPVSTGATDIALDAIAAPHVALALWTRPVPVDLAALDLATVDDLSLLVTGEAPGAALREAGYPAAIAGALAADIARLATRHRRLTGAAAIKVRLDVIETDACRRFHADYVTLRMLCTYRGAGTQWCHAAAPERVQQLAAGTVGVFKGRIAMEEPLILHRSPPLQLCGGRRLLLVLDPA